MRLLRVMFHVGISWLYAEDLWKEKDIEIRKYHLYFQSITKGFLNMLYCFFGIIFFFSLDNMDLYLKALCSVYFLEKDYMIVCLL